MKAYWYKNELSILTRGTSGVTKCSLWRWYQLFEIENKYVQLVFTPFCLNFYSKEIK